MKKPIKNDFGITNHDLLLRVIGMAQNISAMKKSIDNLKSIMKSGKEFNEDEYNAFVDLFAIENAEKLTQEEFNAFVKTDRNKINNTIILVEKEIKKETKLYISIVSEIQDKYPDVYETLQEYTAQLLSSNQ